MQEQKADKLCMLTVLDMLVQRTREQGGKSKSGASVYGTWLIPSFPIHCRYLTSPLSFCSSHLAHLIHSSHPAHRCTDSRHSSGSSVFARITLLFVRLPSHSHISGDFTQLYRLPTTLCRYWLACSLLLARRSFHGAPSADPYSQVTPPIFFKLDATEEV